MQGRLVVEKMLNGRVGVELGEEQRRVAQPRTANRERVSFVHLHCTVIRAPQRIVRRHGELLGRHVAPECQRRIRRRRLVQFGIAFEGPASGQVGEPYPEQVIVAVFELGLRRNQRLIQVCHLPRVGLDIGVVIRARIRQCAGCIELGGADVGQHERRPYHWVK